MSPVVGIEPPEDRLPVLDCDRFSRDNRRRLSGPGLRTFIRVADLWKLTGEQRRLVLCQAANSTYCGWLEAAGAHGDVTLSANVLMRISAVLGIHQVLQILQGNDREGVAWLRRPHGSTVFAGRKPLDFLVDGTLEGLMTVRRFLDTMLQGQAVEPNAVDQDFQPYTTTDIVML